MRSVILQVVQSKNYTFFPPGSPKIEHFSVRNRETTTYCIIFPPGFFLSFGKVLEDCLNTKTAQKDP